MGNELFVAPIYFKVGASENHGAVHIRLKVECLLYPTPWFLNRGHGEFTPPDTDLDRCGLFLKEISPIPALKFGQSFLITH